MTYETTTHPKFAPGQVWSRSPSNGLIFKIVAIDSCPSGLVVNVVIEDGSASLGVRELLAPISLDQVENYLHDLVSQDFDFTVHLDSYHEWKALAQSGKAGFWSCPPDQILATVRQSRASS